MLIEKWFSWQGSQPRVHMQWENLMDDSWSFPLRYGSNQAALGWPWWACSSPGHHPQPCTVFRRHLASRQLHTGKMSLPVALTGVILAALPQGLLQGFLTAFQLPWHTGWPSGHSPVRNSLTQQFLKVGPAAAAKKELLEIKTFLGPRDYAWGSVTCVPRSPCGILMHTGVRTQPQVWVTFAAAFKVTDFIPACGLASVWWKTVE